MPRGGKRPGTGSKPGVARGPYASTISKEQAREALRQVVLKNMERMVRSQMANAMGIGHLFTRDKTGKFSRITNEDEALMLLEEGEEGKDFFIFMKDPSVQAFTDLMNRALDKPKEQEQEVAVQGKIVLEIAKPW